MAQSLGMLGIIGWLLTIGLIIGGPFAISLLYGSSFSESVNAVFPLALALIPMVLFQFNSRVALIMGGTQRNIMALIVIGLIKGAFLVVILTLMNNVTLIATVFCLGIWALWFISAYRNEKCRDIASHQGGGVWAWIFSSDARKSVLRWLDTSRRTGDILPN
jgi:O-antigen/teichoic acid export membrane protein